MVLRWAGSIYERERTVPRSPCARNQLLCSRVEGVATTEQWKRLEGACGGAIISPGVTINTKALGMIATSRNGEKRLKRKRRAIMTHSGMAALSSPCGIAAGGRLARDEAQGPNPLGRLGGGEQGALLNSTLGGTLTGCGSRISCQLRVRHDIEIHN